MELTQNILHKGAAPFMSSLSIFENKQQFEIEIEL